MKLLALAAALAMTGTAAIAQDTPTPAPPAQDTTAASAPAAPAPPAHAGPPPPPGACRLVTRDPMARRAVRQRRLAEWRLQRGLAMLATGELVVTDRLHAHILSLLLDIPHVLLDNSYGKVAGFADQWTRDYSGLMHATTRAEAFDTALACRAPQIVDG